MGHEPVHPSHYHSVIRMVNIYLLVFYSLYTIFDGLNLELAFAKYPIRNINMHLCHVPIIRLIGRCGH
jgi:hypothetical protein